MKEQLVVGLLCSFEMDIRYLVWIEFFSLSMVLVFVAVRRFGKTD